MKRKFIATFSFGLIAVAGIAAMSVPALLINTSVPSISKAGSADTGDQIHGQVFYKQRMALPSQAILSVQLIDQSDPSGRQTTLVEAKTPIDGQIPIEFTLPIKTSELKENGSYVLFARIAVGDSLWFVNETPISVDKDRSAYLIRLATVEQPSMGMMRKNGIRGREWVADTIGNTPIISETRISLKIDGSAVTRTAAIQAPLMTARHYNVNGTGGCNSYFSTAKLDEEQNSLRIEPLGMTYMLCSESVSRQEAHFADMMAKVRSYQLDDANLLYLMDENNTVLSRFHPQ